MLKSSKLVLFILLFFTISCDKSSDTPITHEKTGDYTITINFEYGEDFSTSTKSNIYVSWIENEGASFKQNIVICNKLVDGGLTGTALPYWKLNTYPGSDNSEVDAVTSATIAKRNFSASAKLKDTTIRKFTVYFETDRSFEPNDWFNDQPALLYAVEINLDDNISEYELLFVGWTPNEGTQNVIANTPIGQLQNEVRYITHHKENTFFGIVDERSSTRMVKKVSLAIIKN